MPDRRLVQASRCSAQIATSCPTEKAIADQSFFESGAVVTCLKTKLKTIKDVCAQYFSKYEKHLINHQTIVKDLERQ